MKKVRFGSNYYFFNLRGFFRLWNIFGVQTEDCSKGRLKKKKVVKKLFVSFNVETAQI